MKTLLLFSAALLCAASSFGAQSTNAPYAATLVPNIQSLSTNRVPVPNETVLVPRGRTNPYPSVLSFTYRPDISTNQVRWPVRVAARTNGVYESDQAYAAALDVRFWGIVGDNFTDNYPALTNLIAYASTNMVEICFPAGKYRISKPIKITHNFPVVANAIGGSFFTAWNSTNDTTEAKLIYTGPATNVFVDINASTGFLYGVNLSRLTIDANGLADVAIRTKNVSRGTINQLRARNAKYAGWVIDNSTYLDVFNYSCSANEEPFAVPPAVGLLLTNAANVCTFSGTTISGTTNWAVEIVEGGQGSTANTFIDSGLESNIGGAVHIGQNCYANGFSSIWIENNGATNRQIQVDANAFLNSFDRVYMESGPTGRGNVVLDGIYNTFENSRIGTLTLSSSSGHNILRNLILDLGQLPTPLQYAWAQRVENVIDAAAVRRMNIMPDASDHYGTINIYQGSTNKTYPKMQLGQNYILFGPGTNNPIAGWTLPDGSVSTLVSSNTLVTYRSSSTDGILSSYVGGDTYPRVSLNIDSTYAVGVGTLPADVSFTRLASGVWLSTGAWYVRRTNATDGAFATYMVGEGNPRFYIRENGSHEWGAGGTNSLDTSMYRSAAGRLHVDTDFEVGGGIYLGGVYRSSWPSSGTTYTGTNGVSVSGSVISSYLAAGSNVTLSTNGATGQITISSTGGAGATNGTPVSVNAGGTLAAANFQSTTNVTITASGTNITATVTNSGVTAGLYYPASISVGSDGRVFTASNSTSAEILSRVTIDKGLTNNAGTLQLLVAAGSNVTFTTNGNTITIASTASGGSGAGTNVIINGVLVQPAKFTNTATVTWGTNVNGEIQATAAAGGSGLGTNLFVNNILSQPAKLTNSATVTWSTNANGDIVATAAAGGSGAGTNLFVNNILSQPAKLTNSTDVTWATNANGDIKASLGSITNDFASRSSTNYFSSSNTLAAALYLHSDLFFREVSQSNDLFGFYQSGGKLYGWSGSSTNSPLGKNIWLSVDRYPSAPQQVGDITLTSLGTIYLNGTVSFGGAATNSYSLGAKQLTAGTNLTLNGTLQAGGSFGSAGQFLTSTGTGVGWSNAPVVAYTAINSADWYPPASNYPILSTTNGSPVGIFSPDTTQTLEFNKLLPNTLSAVPSQLTLITRWRPMVGNTNSQNIIVGAKVQAIKDSDSFNTAVLVTNTVSGTTWVTFTNVITSLTGLTLGGEFTTAVYADNAGSATNNYQMSLTAALTFQ